MDHRLRWRDCVWRMGDQDVMRLCSTLGRYVTSLEIRHFWELPPCARWHNLAGSWETNQRRQRFTLSSFDRTALTTQTPLPHKIPKNPPCPWKKTIKGSMSTCTVRSGQKLAVCGVGFFQRSKAEALLTSHLFEQLLRPRACPAPSLLPLLFQLKGLHAPEARSSAVQHPKLMSKISRRGGVLVARLLRFAGQYGWQLQRASPHCC
ncbi:hypothetical protein GGI35DRAFT_128422 [Trichoderma velutinum]